MLHVPKVFAEHDPASLRSFIESYSFATLISPDPQDPPVSHLPMLLDASRGRHGVLLGHMARANPHWRHMQAQPSVLCVFHGPHAYVSPSLYTAHPSVPTWNYATVHVSGRVRLLHEAVELEPLLRRLVDTFESGRPRPWRMELPPDYLAQMLKGIVGFEIEIERITGKFKLSQNRPAQDRERVTEAFGAGDPQEREVAGLMRASRGDAPV